MIVFASTTKNYQIWWKFDVVITKIILFVLLCRGSDVWLPWCVSAERREGCVSWTSSTVRRERTTWRLETDAAWRTHCRHRSGLSALH